jgi:hypothetical protein
MKMSFQIWQRAVLAYMVVLLWGVPAAVEAQFTYITNNGTITITKYNPYEGTASIPAQINGLPVTEIGTNAFLNCGMTNVTIPDSVTTIDDSAFFGCFRLTNVMIPDSVTIIGVGPFEECQHLTAIMVPADNPNYSSLNGVLFNKSQTELVQFPGGLASYTIPNSVVTIANSAFSHSYYLTNVTIPNGVTSIGNSAFFECTLVNVMIPDSMITIGDSAFFDCTSLINLTIPDSVTTIEGSAFFECTSLTNMVIGNSVTNIGSSAFQACFGLTNVTISDSVTTIGDGVFILCTSLKSINVAAQNPNYSSLNGVLFNKSQTEVVEFPAGLAESYTIPNGVTNIGDSAFSYCRNLTNVIIPNSVTSIGDSAFFECFDLANLTIPDSVITIGDSALYACSGLSTLIIPSSVTNIGKSALGADGLADLFFIGNAPAADPSAFLGLNGSEDYPRAIYYLPNTIGWSNTFAGASTTPWLPQILSSGSNFGVRSNQFGFNIVWSNFWSNGQAVEVQACTNLANPVWTPIGTNILIVPIGPITNPPTNGSSYFVDPQWTNYPNRFYRLFPPWIQTMP